MQCFKNLFRDCWLADGQLVISDPALIYLNKPVGPGRPSWSAVGLMQHLSIVYQIDLVFFLY